MGQKKVLSGSKNDLSLQGCFNSARATYKFIGFVFMSLLGFGFKLQVRISAMTILGALEDNFKVDLDMSTKKFVLLYSIYSWPNVIMCFIGGFLLDRVFGIRWGTIIYMALAMIGQLIFALGAYVDAFWLMMVGRFVFGIGGVSLVVAQNSYVVLWFKGHHKFNTVFSLQLNFSRVGSTVNFLIMQNIYGYVSKTLGYKGPECIGIVLFFTALTCVGSMLCALFLGYMDNYAEKALMRNEGQDTAEIVKLTDVKDFRNVYWFLTAICVTYSTIVFQFLSLAKVYFMTKYEFEPATANTTASLLYVISAIASPIVGFLIDKIGKNIVWIIISIVGSLLAHGLLAFTYVTPYVSMVILGISSSLFESSFWTLIGLVVSKHQLGTAYGLILAILNVCLAVTPIICGIIVDKYGYFMIEMFFLVLLFISLVSSVIVFVLDRNNSEVCSDKNTLKK